MFDCSSAVTSDSNIHRYIPFHSNFCDNDSSRDLLTATLVGLRVLAYAVRRHHHDCVCVNQSRSNSVSDLPHQITCPSPRTRCIPWPCCWRCCCIRYRWRCRWRWPRHWHCHCHGTGTGIVIAVMHDAGQHSNRTVNLVLHNSCFITTATGTVPYNFIDTKKQRTG